MTTIDGPVPVTEEAAYLSDIAEDELGAAPVTQLMRSPSGRLVPVVPLDASLDLTFAPFRRPRNAEPAPRWVGLFLGALAVLFVPYVVTLGMQLPDHEVAAHYATAWVGLDVMELSALVATAWFVWRRSTWVAMAATAAATLLVCDAWFDTVNAQEGFVVAVLRAVFLELPMAGFCLWIARHAEVVADRATRLLLRRSARQAELLRKLEGR